MLFYERAEPAEEQPAALAGAAVGSQPGPGPLSAAAVAGEDTPMRTPEAPGGSLGAACGAAAAAARGQALAAAAATDEVQPMALSPAPSAEPQPLLGQQAAAGGPGEPPLSLAPAAALLPPTPYGMPASLYHAIQANNLIQLCGQQVLSVGGACTAPAGLPNLPAVFERCAQSAAYQPTRVCCLLPALSQR